MVRSIKVRLYPTKQQCQRFREHIGASRYIWNWAIDIQKQNHIENLPHIKSFDIIRKLPVLKHDGFHDWLNDISNATLQHACVDLEHAYTRFFRKVAGYPQYKSKKQGSQNFALDSYRTFFKDSVFVQIPSIGLVKYKCDKKLPIGKEHHFKDPRILLKKDKWILVVAVDVEKQNVNLTDTVMGIDLGVKNTITAVCGTYQKKFPNINKSKKIRNLLRKESQIQIRLSRKYRQNKTGNIYHKTGNIKKYEKKVRNIRSKISNIRSNYNHQITAELIKLKPRKIVMEDLNILGMMKNRYLAKAVQSQCFSQIIHHIRYKSENYGIEFVQANRFFPSSRLCRNCGCVNKKLTLADRIFICPECGYKIDRDYNAAFNLIEYKT